MPGRPVVLLCLPFSAAVVTACSAVDNAIDPRYDDINRSTAKARNESILLNIVRASHNAPLNFVAFSRVSGTTSISGNAALPNFLGRALHQTASHPWSRGSRVLDASFSRTGRHLQQGQSGRLDDRDQQFRRQPAGDKQLLSGPAASGRSPDPQLLPSARLFARAVVLAVRRIGSANRGGAAGRVSQRSG